MLTIMPCVTPQRIAGWFSWDEIHQNEKIAHSDYFNNTSISKTPKIYKEYRDFIINKFREDPTRRLTFTEVRKCLIGDVGSIHKIDRACSCYPASSCGKTQLSDFPFITVMWPNKACSWSVIMCSSHY